MIQLIRPVPGHLDADEVQRLAAEGIDYVTGRRMLLKQRGLYSIMPGRERDQLSRDLDACTYVLGEARPAAARLAPALVDLEIARRNLAADRKRYEESLAREAACAAAVAALEALQAEEHADALAEAEADATGAEVAA